MKSLKQVFEGKSRKIKNQNGDSDDEARFIDKQISDAPPKQNVGGDANFKATVKDGEPLKGKTDIEIPGGTYESSDIPSEVRSAYDNEYGQSWDRSVKAGQLRGKGNQASSDAYNFVEKKYGKEMRNRLAAFHQSNPNEDVNEAGDVKVVHNKLLGGWYVVRGSHQTPLGGKHDSKEAAHAWLKDQQTQRDQKMAAYIDNDARRHAGELPLNKRNEDLNEAKGHIDTAYNWHGGGSSALYSFASTGGVVHDEDHRDDLKREIQSNIDWTNKHLEKNPKDKDYKNEPARLNSLLKHVSSAKAKHPHGDFSFELNHKNEGIDEAKLAMPLKGHDYHTKSDEELHYIAKDAHDAAQAMKGHDAAAENKYLDQVNDASTVLYYRKKGGKQVKKNEDLEEKWEGDKWVPSNPALQRKAKIFNRLPASIRKSLQNHYMPNLKNTKTPLDYKAATVESIENNDSLLDMIYEGAEYDVDEINEGKWSSFNLKGRAATFDKEKKEWDIKEKDYDNVKAQSRKHAINKTLGSLQKEFPDHKEHEVSIKEDEVNELSPETLGSYINKAQQSASWSQFTVGKLYGKELATKKRKSIDDQEQSVANADRATKREVGIERAVNKLVKKAKANEDEEVNELSPETLSRYISKSSVDATHQDNMSKLGKIFDKKDDVAKHKAKGVSRLQGIAKAANKLAQKRSDEEVMSDEVKKSLSEFIKDAAKTRTVKMLPDLVEEIEVIDEAQGMFRANFYGVDDPGKNDDKKYKIIRFHKEGSPKTLKRGLTLSQAQSHAGHSDTSSSTATSRNAKNYTKRHGAWFDGYDVDKR